MAADEAFTAALDAVLQREVDGFRSLVNCRQLTAGASQETYKIQCETDCVTDVGLLFPLMFIVERTASLLHPPFLYLAKHIW